MNRREASLEASGQAPPPKQSLFGHHQSRHRDRCKPGVCVGSRGRCGRMVFGRAPNICDHLCNLRENRRDLARKVMRDDRLSLSVFTIEVDRKPVVAFAARKYSDAEAICADQRIRTKLNAARSGGKPLCDELATLRVRLANPGEKNRYREQTSARSADAGLPVYLVDLDR